MKPETCNVVCLIVDRLRAAALGTFGNTWFETPALDRLASESFVFDRAFVDSPDLESIYEGYWQGRHLMAPKQPCDAAHHLASRARQAGYFTALVTDEPQLANSPSVDPFQQCALVGDDEEAPEPLSRPADAPPQTHLARLFAETSDWLADASAAPERNPFFLWIHARGMAAPWDAPLQLRNALIEEDDPPPPQDARVPQRALGDDPDPDEIHGAACAYAGQVMLLDTCLAALLGQMREQSLSETTLFVLVGLRGFPLGEHRQLGDVDGALYEELVHVPWLVRLPDGRGAMGRSGALVQPADLYATLCDWMQGCGKNCGSDEIGDTDKGSCGGMSLLPIASGQQVSGRDYVTMRGPGSQRAVRTPAWYLRCGDLDSAGKGATAGEDSTVELFAKPDDRWDQNEVASRCPTVVSALTALLLQVEQAWQNGELAKLPPLDPALREGPD